MVSIKGQSTPVISQSNVCHRFLQYGLVSNVSKIGKFGLFMDTPGLRIQAQGELERGRREWIVAVAREEGNQQCSAGI